jgi:hypothetical protein
MGIGTKSRTDPTETELVSFRCDSLRTIGAKRLEVCREQHFARVLGAQSGPSQ